MALEEYGKKRSFNRTPEPEGDQPVPTETLGGEFCVQRHNASRLHYDLRLEVGGVLKSWAVPKGPTLDPDEKRMAVHVEDHPLKYATFEGVIPKGNYGAGSMMLYDHGSYEVIGPPSAQAQLDRGDFKFRLHGHKLQGDFVLVRTREANQWLLIKKKDPHAVKGWDSEMYVRSVKTGRTQEEIAQQLEAGLGSVPGAAEAPMPHQLTPMMASPQTAPPSDPGWLFEVKWDGVRALSYIEGNTVRTLSRNFNPMDRQYPELALLTQVLDVKNAIVDAEIVALDERGIPSFGRLQSRMHVTDAGAVSQLTRSVPITIYLFDLLYLDGWDLRNAALEDRKRLLSTIVRPSPIVKLSDHFQDQGRELFTLAQQTGLEGILAKRMGSRYESKRSLNWLKIKITQQQEFVICGYTPGERREFFSSLVLGLYERPDAERPIYVGNVGSGFDQESLERVSNALSPLVIPETPFPAVPAMMRPAIWTRPELICEVKYSSWTHEQRLRAPVFLGLRNDLQPRDCILETAQSITPETVFPIPPPLLADTRDKVILDIDQRRLTFTNLNKLYYPQEGYTKRDVINYYSQVADLILPHLQDRALSLRRYPDGIEGESFFQKEAAEHFPEWLRVEPIHSNHNDSSIRFVVADDRASLLFLANLGCIDQNPWMSRLESIENPDFLLIDLDPQECTYDKIIEAAQLVRQKLDLLELCGYPKTTGGDGMHIYVPLEPIYTYEQVRSLAQVLSHVVVSSRPELFTTQRAVSKREKSRVYFDWAQIASGKTISAPYVLRAYPGAPVATPLEWREVRPGLVPQQFHLRNALERFARVGDLFAPVLQKRQKLDSAISKIETLVRS